MAIKIILADDHRIIREGLRALLEKEPGVEVIAEAADGRTTVKLCRELVPDVVIMDITMPDLNGIEATHQILSEMPDIKVIALSMHSDKRFVSEMLNAGALAYLLKDAAFEELSDALRAVNSNQLYLSAHLEGLKDYLGRVRTTQVFDSSPTLTTREREVLQLLAEGKTTHQIASSLCLSGKTVAAHRTQIMNKLGLKSIAELTKYAIREGLTALE
ncbi:MAG: response regulator transcription factor [Thermodesulfobacteriota bacterium]|nr:response regulator transcription factor [Thermodesulfobacteriota bacterium]